MVMAQLQQLQQVALPPPIALSNLQNDPNDHLPMAPVYAPTRQDVEKAQDYHQDMKISHGILVSSSSSSSSSSDAK